jgi:hypothetical protein
LGGEIRLRCRRWRIRRLESRAGRVERAAMAANHVCERDQRELAGVVCFGDHVGHREVGAEPVTGAALDVGAAVGQVGVEAR